VVGISKSGYHPFHVLTSGSGDNIATIERAAARRLSAIRYLP
jgi:hypothetical protein